MKYLLSILCLFGFIFCETDLGMWEIKYYVDTFGDPTNTPYITNKGYEYGHFENSATSYSQLKVDFIIASESEIAIKLYEYAGIHPVKSGNYTIYFKHNGESSALTGTISSDRLNLYRPIMLQKHTGYTKLLNAFKSGGEIRFHIKEQMDLDVAPSEYHFTLQDVTGFNNVKSI